MVKPEIEHVTVEKTPLRLNPDSLFVLVKATRELLGTEHNGLTIVEKFRLRKQAEFCNDLLEHGNSFIEKQIEIIKQKRDYCLLQHKLSQGDKHEDEPRV